MPELRVLHTGHASSNTTQPCPKPHTSLMPNPLGVLTICSQDGSASFTHKTLIWLLVSLGSWGFFFFLFCYISSSICMCSKQDGRLCAPIWSSILPGNLKNFFLNLKQWLTLCSLGFLARWTLEQFFSFVVDRNHMDNFGKCRNQRPTLKKLVSTHLRWEQYIGICGGRGFSRCF